MSQHLLHHQSSKCHLAFLCCGESRSDKHDSPPHWVYCPAEAPDRKGWRADSCDVLREERRWTQGPHGKGRRRSIFKLQGGWDYTVGRASSGPGWLIRTRAWNWLEKLNMHMYGHCTHTRQHGHTWTNSHKGKQRCSGGISFLKTIMFINIFRAFKVCIIVRTRVQQVFNQINNKNQQYDKSDLCESS